MGAKRKLQASLRKKKKSWYNIVTTKLFNEMSIGETRVYESTELIGKPIKANLMVLTNDIKKQNVNMLFKVAKVSGEIAVAEPVGFETMPAAIKRLIRRARDRIDSSFVCKTQDKKFVRVKIVLITRNNTARSVRSLVRRSAERIVADAASNTTFEKLLLNIINNKVQITIRDSLKRVYPLRSVDVRMLELVNSPAGPVVEIKPGMQVIPEITKEPTEEELSENEAKEQNIIKVPSKNKENLAIDSEEDMAEAEFSESEDSNNENPEEETSAKKTKKKKVIAEEDDFSSED